MKRIANHRLKLFSLFIVFFFFVSCGKKGPLKLPVERPVEKPAVIENAPQPDTAPRIPSKVTGLEAFVTVDRVLLFWSANPEEWVKEYRVFMAEGMEDYKEIAVTQTPALVDEVKLTTRRFYKVRAVGLDGEGPFSEPITVIPQ